MLLALLSPAKRLRLSQLPADLPHSQPEFLADARILAQRGRQLNRMQAKRLMQLSNILAEQCLGYFAAFAPPLTPDNARHAVLAFRGDTSIGLDPDRFDQSALSFAQDHLRILSGFYGLLRPLDLIQPYRLEMAARLDNPRGSDLYEFWGRRIARALKRDTGAAEAPVIVNLASVEYFKAVDRTALRRRVVTPVFREIRDGRAIQMGFHAKRARGMMARFIIENRLRRPEQLTGFDRAGYRFRPALSTNDRLEFHRINEGKGRMR